MTTSFSPPYAGLAPSMRLLLAKIEARKIGTNSGIDKSAQPLGAPRVAPDAEEICAVGAVGATPSLPSPLPPSTPHQSRKLQRAKQSLAPSLSRPWRELWPHEKLAAAFDAAGKLGGIAFSLNLSSNRETYINSAADPLDSMRRYMGRELRRAFGHPPPFGFAIEIDPRSGKTHLHGIVVPPASAADTIGRLREALVRAGGRIKGKAAARQVRLVPVTDGLGWAAYTQKGYDAACSLLGIKKPVFISTQLARIANK